MGFTMSKVAWRRANQFGDLVTVLKLGTIDFDSGSGVAEQGFRHGLYDARLARSRGTKKKQVPYRASRRIQAGEKHLVDFHYLLNRRVLPDNLPPQRQFKILRIRAAATRIKCCIKTGTHISPRLFRRGRLRNTEAYVLRWTPSLLSCNYRSANMRSCASQV